MYVIFIKKMMYVGGKEKYRKWYLFRSMMERKVSTIKCKILNVLDILIFSFAG